MSQCDASATPMYGCFQPTPVLTPYSALPARVPLDEINRSTAFGAQASLRTNLDEADMAPELELNEIIWKSARGADSPMPPPRRAWFVSAPTDGADADGDGDEVEEREPGDRRPRTP